MYAKNFTNFSWLTSGSSNARGSTRRTWSQSTMRWDTFSTTYSTRTSPTSTGRNSTTYSTRTSPTSTGLISSTYSTRTSPTSTGLNSTACSTRTSPTSTGSTTYIQYKNLTYLCKYCSNCKRLFLKNSLLFRSGANPGFHEGVADIISLAVGTATYFQRLGTATVDP